MTDSHHKNELPSSQARPTSRFFGRTTLRTPQEALQPDAAPPPPPDDRKRPSQRRPTLSAISGFLSFLMLAAIGGVVMLAVAERKLSTPGPLSADKVVFIAPRTEVVEVIDQLASAGVIDQPTLVKASLWLEGRWSQVKAGEYLFKREASLRDVMDTIVSGRQLLHSVTIPEGLTSEQIVQRLKEIDILAGDIRQIPPEGTLLPETYRVTRGMSRNDLIRKMQLDHNRLVDQVWEKRGSNLPIRSKYEMVTLASIVEKETGRADERTRVAAVFHNRLNKRMRLQSDPTIVYGIAGGKGTLGRPILRSEITRPTAYNTYVIEGLPPGPIANPGRAALEAVVNPSRTSDLFFVADGTGGHAFAETLDQHNRNVARWREIERDMRARQDATPEADRAAPDDGASAPTPAAAPANSRQRRSEAPASSFGSIAAGAFGVASAARVSPRGPLGFRSAHWPQTPTPLVASSYRLAPIASMLLPTTTADKNSASGRAALRAIAANAPTESAPSAATAFAPTSSLGDATSLNFAGFDRTRAAAVPGAAQAQAEVASVVMTGDVDDETDGIEASLVTVPVSGKRLSDMEARAARFRAVQD
ncbi:MAG: endolytic transglycosylase MltG [Beijerinckiaceae bacterium]|nr:endolytic transglycosylase MltG [Beijerinckiaceae bacterium]